MIRWCQVWRLSRSIVLFLLPNNLTSDICQEFIGRPPMMQMIPFVSRKRKQNWLNEGEKKNISDPAGNASLSKAGYSGFLQMRNGFIPVWGFGACLLTFFKQQALRSSSVLLIVLQRTKDGLRAGGCRPLKTFYCLPSFCSHHINVIEAKSTDRKSCAFPSGSELSLR